MERDRVRGSSSDWRTIHTSRAETRAARSATVATSMAWYIHAITARGRSRRTRRASRHAARRSETGPRAPSA